MTCHDCGSPYRTTYVRSTLCPRCWAEQNGVTGKLVCNLIFQIEELESDLADERVQREWERQHRPSALEGDLLKKVLMLAHPDKHGGSPLATKVFQQLQTMKERQL